MKTLIISALTLVSLSALACPDLSGIYKRVDSLGCKMNHQKSLRYAYPLNFSMGDRQDGFISDGDIFKITQNGCKSLSVHYTDPTYIDGQQDRTITLDLTKGEVETTENSLSYSQKEKVETRCYIGCSTGKTNRKFSLSLENDVLSIKSVTKTRALINFVIPWIENDRVNCKAVKL